MEHPADRQAIDALVTRFFAIFDNRHGARPRLEDLVACFADQATIARRASDGTDLFTVTEFALPRIALLSQGTLLDFHEWETAATTEVYDGIATRTSRYRKAGLLDGHAYAGSGTKAFHFVRLGSGWRITSIVWVDDVG